MRKSRGKRQPLPAMLSRSSCQGWVATATTAPLPHGDTATAAISPLNPRFHAQGALRLNETGQFYGANVAYLYIGVNSPFPERARMGELRGGVSAPMPCALRRPPMPWSITRTSPRCATGSAMRIFLRRKSPTNAATGRRIARLARCGIELSHKKGYAQCRPSGAPLCNIQTGRASPRPD